jgi:osmotically-inducible protein OsmY
MGASAHAGVVRLTGVADSNASRRIAEDDVLALRGVLQVIDDLAVEPTRRTDAQVAREVDRILRDDVWLDASQVEERVSRGVVTLTGSVKSAAEKARAEDDALADSPEGVNVVALRIDPIDDGTSRSDGRAARTDDDLTAALLDAYARDPRVRPFVPGIEIRSGVAVLTGTAPDPWAARAAAEDARNVTGMEEAHDDLNAPAKGAESDATVLHEARGAIDSDPGLSARGLTVEVLHGRLALRGAVASESERRHAISVATSVRGVLGVDDDLVIDPPKLTSGGRR